MMDAPETLAATLLRVAAVQFLLMLLVRSWAERHVMSSVRACRAVCVLVLLQGWLLAPITIPIAWYESSAVGDDRNASDAATVASRDEADWDAWLRSAPPSTRRGTPNAVTVSTTDDSSPHSMSRALSWSDAGCWLILVWLAGIACLVVQSFLTYSLHVLKRRSDAPADSVWQREWAALLRQRGIRCEIPLVETDQLGPMLCLLPSGYVACVPHEFGRTATPQERRIVLRHELAHYERGDVWKSWLVRMFALPQWFNPAAWWAVRTFEQCAEHACDAAAATTPVERLEFAKLLSRLAVGPLPQAAFGRCVHSHPLIARVRCLLNPPFPEESIMKKLVVFAIVGVCVTLHLFRVELVAKEPAPATKESVAKRVEELDQKLALLKADVKSFKETGMALKQEVEGKVDELKTLGKDKANLSDELKRRVGLFETGDEAKQLEVLDKLEDLNENEGLLALGAAAKDSQHEKVRQKALQTIAGWRKAGLPAFAFAASSLSNADRVFFAKELAKHDTT